MRTRSRSRSSLAMRTPMRRRSVSSFVSPGPRVPIPPPSRESEAPCPVRRGSRYAFGCASSTLKATFRGASAAGEDVQDQLCPVDNAGADGFFDVALLGRRQIVIDDDDIGFERLYELPDLLDFALAEQRSGLDVGTDLKDFRGDDGVGAESKFLQFGKRFPGGSGRRAATTFETGENGSLGGLFKRDRRRCTWENPLT